MSYIGNRPVSTPLDVTDVYGLDAAIDAAAFQATMVNEQLFSADGTWLKSLAAPSIPSMLMLEGWGPGGGGSSHNMEGGSSEANGGLGGDYASLLIPFSVIPDTIAISIGVGGLGATSNPSAGFHGTQTTIAGFLIAAAGSGGMADGNNSATVDHTSVLGLSPFLQFNQNHEMGEVATAAQGENDGLTMSYAGGLGGGSGGNSIEGLPGVCSALGTSGGVANFSGVGADGGFACGGGAGTTGGGAGGSGYVRIRSYK